MTQNQWKQQFVQKNFISNINIYRVTKILLDTIKPLNITQRCKLIIYSNYCYLTIDNGRILPSFALPLIINRYCNNFANNSCYIYTNRKRAITTNSINKTNKQFSVQRQKSQPPPVTLDMLANYSKHNLLIDDNIYYNAKLKQDKPVKRPKPAAPPRSKYKQIKRSKSIPPPPTNYINYKICEKKSINNAKPILSQQHNCTNYQIHEKQTINNPSSDTSDADSESSGDKSSSSKSNSNVINENNNYKYDTLLKIYNGYVQDINEKPSNTFDLMNYIQFNSIRGINFIDVNTFLMNYK